MTFNSRNSIVWVSSLTLALGGCATGGALQPDRSVFSLDGNYQRYEYPFAIEETFDRTVKVFREGGYSLDVVDRATGQISGERTRTRAGDHPGGTDKGLKFYALVMPAGSGSASGQSQSQVAVKIVQIIRQGAIVNTARTEIIVNDGQMYQYMFRRIANTDVQPDGAQPGAPRSAAPRGQLPAAYGQPVQPGQP